LEATQIAINNKLTSLEASVASVDKSLATLLTQRIKRSIKKKTRRKIEWMIIMTMITLLILNMMIETLVIDIAYVTIVEVWVATVDARYTIILMLSVRLN
jgi:L-asparagine transporter-like permease